MASHNQTGKTGELLANDYFLNIGYEVLHRNWRYSHYEVDLIASKDNTLHFIEVKTKRTKKFGLPEDNFTSKKMKNLTKAAEEYLYQNPQWKRIQFDILAIYLRENKDADFFLIEDVF